MLSLLQKMASSPLVDGLSYFEQMSWVPCTRWVELPVPDELSLLHNMDLTPVANG